MKEVLHLKQRTLLIDCLNLIGLKDLVLREWMKLKTILSLKVFFLFEGTLIWLGIDWDVLLKSKAPIIPVTENDIDVSNFEKESKKFHESELESPFLDRSPVRSSYNLIVNIE